MNVAAFANHVTRYSTYPKLPSATAYAALGLIGEVGELAEEVKKLIHKDAGELTPARALRILDELGDVLWYAFALVHDAGWQPYPIVGAVEFRELDELATDDIDPLDVITELAQMAAYSRSLGLTRAFFRSLANLAKWAGWPMTRVAERNVEKLAERHSTAEPSGARLRTGTYDPKSLVVTLGGVEVPPGGIVVKGRDPEVFGLVPTVIGGPFCEGKGSAAEVFGLLGGEGAPMPHPDDAADGDPRDAW